MFRVYISASTQKENVGVGSYGTEQDRMMFLADRVAFYLKAQGVFEVFRNEVGWPLQKTVEHCNNLKCELFIDNHTNAGSKTAQGTEVYYHGNSLKGVAIATELYSQIAPLSKGKDRGVMSDTVLYTSGLYVLKNTNCPAALVEHIYHSNITEVDNYLGRVEEFAIAEARAICKYFGVSYKEIKLKPQGVNVFYNGTLLSSDTKTIILDGKTFVSLRSFAAEIGMEVTWDEASKSIFIEDGR